VAVEKLPRPKMVKTTLQWEALQTTISVLVDIFYFPNSGYFDETGVFQQPQAITLRIPPAGILSVMVMLRQPSRE
jgi:hypothetical protein